SGTPPWPPRCRRPSATRRSGRRAGLRRRQGSLKYPPSRLGDPEMCPAHRLRRAPDLLGLRCRESSDDQFDQHFECEAVCNHAGSGAAVRVFSKKSQRAVAKVVHPPLSISRSLRTVAMISSTLSDRAAVSSEGIKDDAGALSGLNMIAVRLSPGAISE